MVRSRNKVVIAALFVLPAFLIYTVLLVNPIVQSIYMSFFSWNGIAASKLVYVGLSNYKELLAMSEFWRSLSNVGKFILIGFLIQMPLSFFLGVLITSKLRGMRFFKTAFFLPVVLPITAVSLMWTFILFPNGGLLNTLMQAIGLEGAIQNWLGDTSVVTYTTPLINMWVYAGLNMIIFSAGIVGIPEQVYQAGEIDGATGLLRIWHITLPLMKETFKIYSVLCLTGAFRVFDIIFVMTGGGPNGASDVPTTMLYYQAFKYQNFGLANSIGTIILVVGLILSVATNKFFRDSR